MISITIWLIKQLLNPIFAFSTKLRSLVTTFVKINLKECYMWHFNKRQIIFQPQRELIVCINL
jgi:hypothetical protein